MGNYVEFKLLNLDYKFKDAIKDKDNDVFEVIKISIPERLMALKKLYESNLKNTNQDSEKLYFFIRVLFGVFMQSCEAIISYKDFDDLIEKTDGVEVVLNRIQERFIKEALNIRNQDFDKLSKEEKNSLTEDFFKNPDSDKSMNYFLFDFNKKYFMKHPPENFMEQLKEISTYIEAPLFFEIEDEDGMEEYNVLFCVCDGREFKINRYFTNFNHLKLFLSIK